MDVLRSTARTPTRDFLRRDGLMNLREERNRHDLSLNDDDDAYNFFSSVETLKSNPSLP